MKRSPLRRTGRLRSRGKAAAYADAVREDRQQWVLDLVDQHACMWCGGEADFTGFQVHEMIRRSHASNSWWNRANALWVCGPCHAGPIASAPLAQQLACKLLCDPEHFDREAVLRIRDERAMEFVTLRDIVRYLRIDEEVFG